MDVESLSSTGDGTAGEEERLLIKAWPKPELTKARQSVMKVVSGRLPGPPREAALIASAADGAATVGCEKKYHQEHLLDSWGSDHQHDATELRPSLAGEAHGGQGQWRDHPSCTREKLTH